MPIAKKTQAMSKNDKKRHIQQQKRRHLDAKREGEKFFAWLGQVLAPNLSEQDFNSARAMYKQGVSAQRMIEGMYKTSEPKG